MAPTLFTPCSALPPKGARALGRPGGTRFMILIPDFIYLASQSPRRSQLLDQAGIRHELLLPDADEDPELAKQDSKLQTHLPAANYVHVIRPQCGPGLPPGAVLDHYEINRTLGQGAFGVTYQSGLPSV